MRARALALATALAALAACQPSARPRYGHACLVGWGHLTAAPLPIGDSVRLAVGRLVEGKGCLAPAPGPVRWTTADSAVVAVTPGGFVVGRAAGTFALHSVVRGAVDGVVRVDTLAADGFVLPRDYRVRVVPESATVAVGDTVMFEARAEAADGTLLPRVPHSLAHSEERIPRVLRRLGDPPPPPRPLPLVEGTGVRWMTDPRPVVAVRPGTTQVIGVIGGMGGIGPREARATLRIRDGAAKRP